VLPDELNSNNDNFMNGGTFANVCVFLVFAVFALAVNYVIKAVTSEDELS